MGDGAKQALNSWVKSGMPCGLRIKPIVRVNCPECGKEVHGKGALMQHQNAKHNYKYSWPEICSVQDDERWDLK